MRAHRRIENRPKGVAIYNKVGLGAADTCLVRAKREREAS